MVKFSEVTAAGQALAEDDIFLLSQDVSGTQRTRSSTLGALSDFLDKTTATNYEVLGGDKTLSIGSPRNQFLSGGGGARNVTLDATTEVTGTTFFIVQALSSGSLVIKSSGGTTLTTLSYAGEGVRYTWSGAAWLPVTVPTSFITGGIHYVGFNYDATPPTATIIGVGNTGKIHATATGVGVSTGGTAPSALFHVSAAGNANALLVDDTTGHVGIGAAADATYLVKLTDSTTYVAFYITGTNAAVVTSDGTHTVRVGVNSGTPWVGTDTNHALDLAINGTARGRIQTNGELSWGTTTPDPSCLINMVSDHLGLGLPVMTTTNRDNDIDTPRAGLVIYNSTTGKINVYNGAAWEVVTSV